MWAAGPRPLRPQHHLSRAETSGKAPRSTRLLAAWRGGAGAGGPVGQRGRPPLARPAHPIADLPPAFSRAAGKDPLGGWAGRGEGKRLPEPGGRRGRGQVAAVPNTNARGFFPGTVSGRDFPVSRPAGPRAAPLLPWDEVLWLPDRERRSLPRPLKTDLWLDTFYQISFCRGELMTGIRLCVCLCVCVCARAFVRSSL